MHHSFPVSDLMFLTQLQLCVCLSLPFIIRQTPGAPLQELPAAVMLCRSQVLGAAPSIPGQGQLRRALPCCKRVLANAESMELMLQSWGMWVLCCRWGFVLVNKLK